MHTVFRGLSFIAQGAGTDRRLPYALSSRDDRLRSL